MFAVLLVLSGLAGFITAHGIIGIANLASRYDDQIADRLQQFEDELAPDELMLDDPPTVPGSAVDDVFAERDRFFQEQQLVPGVGRVSAKTPQHRAFIEDLQAEFAAKGLRWTPEWEAALLALALDACETSILNSHAVSPETVKIHMWTAPLLTEFREDATDTNQLFDRFGEYIALGTSHICPADADDWKTGVDVNRGSW